jgi:hypothetical protein
MVRCAVRKAIDFQTFPTYPKDKPLIQLGKKLVE